MSVLWIILWLIPYSRSIVLPCDYEVDDVCSDSEGDQCSVTCAEQCSLFISNGQVSFCGWLQSFGYSTTELLATSLKYNLRVQALPSESDPIVADRVKRRTEASAQHIYPFISFKFTTHPTSAVVKIGTKVEFECSAEANSSLSYKWYKKERFIPILLAGASDSVYTISQAASSHMGYYICEVTESVSGDVYWSNPAKLEVLYLEIPSEAATSRYMTVESGRKKESVSCQLPKSYPPANATWFRYDASDVPQQIIDLEDTFYDSKTGNLYLINTNPDSHEGKYECRAGNAKLDKYTIVEIVNIAVTGASKAPEFPPTKAYFDEDAAASAHVGDSLLLRCAAYGYPIPQVYWYFGDEVDTLCRIPSSRYTSLDNGRTVILHAVKEQDSDYRYECKAQSTDNSDSQTIGVLTKVGTYKKLEITQDKLNYLPKYISNITLSCPVTGADRSFWYRNGERLIEQSGDYYTQQEADNSITITVSTLTHGVYTCLSLGSQSGDELYGGLALKNLHITRPVLPLTINLFRDLSTDPEKVNQTFLTCAASGFPPPRLYWYENNNIVTDFFRYSFTFDKSNSTVINTTLNISNLTQQTEIKCLAVSQTEHYHEQQEAFYTLYPEGEKSVETVQNQDMYIIIGASVIVVVCLFVTVLFLLWRFRRERESTKPIRTYMKDVQQIQRDGGEILSSKKVLGEEVKYAVQLHEILKTMDIRDEGGLESFKDMLDYWTNEDLDATHDLEYARRFRESFISKRSFGTRFSSSRYGNQFKIDLKSGDKKAPESSMLDETPERENHIPLGRRAESPRRASNPIYAPLPVDTDPDTRSTAL